MENYRKVEYKRDGNIKQNKGEYKNKEFLKADKELAEKKNRYNEREVTQNFLKSDKGFKLLLKIRKNTRFDSDSSDIIHTIDGLIDLFSTWTGSFPVRKNLKVTKYDFLKHVEEFCLKKENADEIEAIIKE